MGASAEVPTKSSSPMLPLHAIRHLILDRDGVLNVETSSGYVESPEQWRWAPTLPGALRPATAAGIRLSVATNQSCIGRGIIDDQTLTDVHQLMLAQARDAGVEIAQVYACPHAPTAGCRCRKPLPGLLELAIHDSQIPRQHTVMLGDSYSDLEAAMAAGVSPWLILTGKGHQTLRLVEKSKIGLKNVRVFSSVDDVVNALTRPDVQ